jgi:anti-sigma regulatory factor (Ser/Thr protein kinase)
MDANAVATTNGRVPVPVSRAGARSELDDLRSICRRQARVINTLGEAISTFRAGTVALNAENDDLRADDHQARERRDTHSRLRGTSEADDHTVEARFAADDQAPCAARAVVTRELRDRVAASVLESARLLASELITNSVRHSGMPADEQLIFRIVLANRVVRVEVQDSGRGGVVAPGPADSHGGGGYGLNIVQTLSERWGLERVAAGGTRVWAQITVEPSSAATSIT